MKPLAIDNNQALSTLIYSQTECLTQITEGDKPEFFYGRAIGAARTAYSCGLIDRSSSELLVTQARNAYERRLGIEPEKFSLQATT